MSRILRILLTLCIFVGGTIFIVHSFMRSSAPQQVAQPPDPAVVPSRVYGKVEPAGREVLVSSPFTKKVVKVYVQEGDRLKKGQKLVSLEGDLEEAQFHVVAAKVESFRRALAISQDNLRRKESLFKKNADTEYAYTQARLQAELDASNLALAEKEVELARVQLGLLELESPIDGLLYKFDVRLGETLTAGDSSKIILGSENLWVRLSVEAFWMDRVNLGDVYKIFKTETNELIGTGEVISKVPYLGRRNFRTEDDQERFDTKYQDVILKLQKDTQNVPLGLSVVAELLPPSPQDKK